MGETLSSTHFRQNDSEDGAAEQPSGVESANNVEATHLLRESEAIPVGDWVTYLDSTRGKLVVSREMSTDSVCAIGWAGSELQLNVIRGDDVLLNGQRVEQSALKTGDAITIPSVAENLKLIRISGHGTQD